METILLTPDDEAEAIVASFGIPPCPEVLIQVLREMRQDDPDVVKVANLISGDVSLAAAVLKTVNSPFFGLQTKAKSIDQALKLMGLRNVKEITTGIMLRDALPVGNAVVLDNFWDTSAAIAQTAALLARPVAKLDRDDAYTFALFRDAGVPLMARRFDNYDQSFVERLAVTESVTALEREAFGTDHTMIGGPLARSWYLTDDIAQAIQLHHDYATLRAGTTPKAVQRHVALALVAETIHSRLNRQKECDEWMRGGDFARDVLEVEDSDLDEHADMVEGILGF
jgi:HD-like signal output (HDOD) protein